MVAASQPYDQRDGYIWMNGELISWRDARVHLLTHALHYGSAVFEGERVYDGEIFKLTEHSQRLHESAKGLDFVIPYSVAEIDHACRDVVRANKLVDGYVRPLAWRGSEQMGVAAQATKINLAIAAWDWGSYFDPAARTKGLRLTIGNYRRPDPSTAPAKSKAAGLYMICTIEKHRAEREGYADALMLDWRGQIAEATGANIFFFKDGPFAWNGAIAWWINMVVFVTYTACFIVLLRKMIEREDFGTGVLPDLAAKEASR